MKFFKLLFNRILLVLLLLLIQISLILVAILILEAFPAFQIVSIIFAFLIFLYIANKKECPEFKLPWLVLLFALPFFTIIVYVLFANSKMSCKNFSRLQTAHLQTKKFTNKTKGRFDYPEEIKGIENYLAANAYLHGHLKNKVTYFKSGEDFWDDLLVELDKAEKFIFMEYFIIEHGKMWGSIHDILVKKVQQGVEVRLMYDDIGSVGKVKSGYFKTLRKEGINCYKFNTFRPLISGVHNNRDHRKITVIDGKIGYTGGLNLGDEYINENRRLGHWKDTAIKIAGSAVDNLLALFLQLYDMNAKTQSDYNIYFIENHEEYEEEGYFHPFGDGPKPFYTEQVGEGNFINMINAAQRYCYITTPYLILDYNLTTALRNAAYRGVDVRIITPHKPDKKIIFTMTRSNYPYLLKAGVKVYEYSPGFIHAKMLVADDKLAFVGTINLDYRSLVHHYECGAVLYGVPCIDDIKADVDETLSVSQEVTLANFKMSKIALIVNAVLNLFSPML